MTDKYTPATLLPVVMRRLADVLPNRTHLSVEDTEGAQAFVAIKQVIYSLKGAGVHEDIMYGILQCLKDLMLQVPSALPANSAASIASQSSHSSSASLATAGSAAVPDRDQLTLRSILVVVKLLAAYLKSEWDGQANTNPTAAEIGLESPILYKKRLPLYTVSPPPVSAEEAGDAIDVFFKISQTCSALALRSDFERASLRHDPSSRASTAGLLFSTNDILIQQIEEYSHCVLYTLCAANWNVVWNQVRLKIQTVRTSRGGDDLPNPSGANGKEFLDYLISILHLSPEHLLLLIQEIHKVCKTVRRPARCAPLLLQFQKALRNWTFNQGLAVYEQSVADTVLRREISTFFDFVYKVSDDLKHLELYPVLANLLVFLPETFRCLGLAKKHIPKDLQKKVAFVNALEKSLHTYHGPELAIAAECLLVLSKSATAQIVVSKLARGSPLEAYCIAAYDALCSILFVTEKKTEQIGPRRYDLQSSFVYSYCVLCPDRVREQVLPLLKSPSAPLIYKRNIIRGLLSLKLRASVVKNRELVLQFYDAELGELLVVVLTCTDLVYKFENPSSSEDIKKDSREYQQQLMTYELAQSTLRIVFVMLTNADAVYRSSAKLFGSIGIYDKVLKALVKCYLSENSQLRLSASQFTLSYLSPANLGQFPADICYKSDSTAVFNMLDAIGLQISEIARNCIGLDLNDYRLRKNLEMITYMFKSRAFIMEYFNFKDLPRHLIAKLNQTDLRLSLRINCETCFLISLCSPLVETCKAALSCFQYLVIESAVIGSIESFDDPNGSSILPNHDVYEELTSSTFIVTGAAAVHKRLFKLLQTSTTPSSGIEMAWREIYKRWVPLSASFTNATDSQRREWRAYSGFLSCLVHLGMITNLGTGAPLYEDLYTDGLHFVNKMIEFLQDKYLKEHARVILAAEVNSTVYPYVIGHLSKLIEASLGKVDAGEELNESQIDLASNVCVLLKALIERLRETDTYISIDLPAFTLPILRRIDLDTTNSNEIVKLRIRICALFEGVSKYKESLNVKHETESRNKFVIVLCSWLDKAAELAFNNTKGTAIAYDEALAIAKALSGLFDGLKLEAQRDDEQQSAKAETFSQLFDLLLKVLDILGGTEDSLNTSSGSGIATGSDRFSQFRAYIISAMSHLLSSNVDVGLELALSVGYHQDLNLRLAFLEIFRNITSTGTVHSHEYSEAKRYEELVNFITEPKNMQFSILLTESCPPNDVDALSAAMLNIFEVKGNCLEFVKACVKGEIRRSTSAASLLRRNCFATKILSAYAKLKGLRFLHSIFNDFFKHVNDYPEDYLFEVDPDKVREESSFKRNLGNYDRALSELLNSLKKNIEDTPYEIRELCRCIAETVTPLFPDAVESSVSAFFFLRFICPVIVAPESEGIVSERPSLEVKRCLLLLAKTIQNMANKSTSHLRSSIEGMAELEDSKAETMNEMLWSLAHVAPPIDARPPARNNGLVVDQLFVLCLHSLLYSQWEEINHRLVTAPKSVLGEGHVDLAAAKRLTVIVRTLGRPSQTYGLKVQRFSRWNSINHQEMVKEFVKRNRDQFIEDETITGIARTSVADDGTPVVVLNYGLLKPDETNQEAIFYRIYKLVESFNGQDFYFLLNCTGVNRDDVLPVLLRDFSVNLLSSVWSKSLKGLYYFCVSSDMLTTIVHDLARNVPVSERFTEFLGSVGHFISSVDVLNEKFNKAKDEFDAFSLGALVDGSRLSFNDVVSKTNLIKTVGRFSIGSAFVQFVAGFTLPNGITGETVDTFHLSQISGWEILSEEDGFEVHVGTKTYHFNHPERVKIIDAITYAVHKLPKRVDSSTALRPEDAVASLLHMSFANLCSAMLKIQRAAYNLLATMGTRFKLDLGREMLAGEGLVMPKNEITMAVALSERISVSHPDMTFDFIQEFFKTYSCVTVNQQSALLLYMKPWMKNLYEYVTTADEELGEERTFSLLRQFLDLTAVSPHYSSLITNIWPAVSLDGMLSDILVEAVSDHFVNHGRAQVKATVTSFPTVSMCGSLLKRIKKLLDKQTPVTVESLTQHEDWDELQVLVTMTAAISFESETLAEQYMPDFFSIITSFLQTGDHIFRDTLFGLLSNVLHAFIGGTKLSPERKEQLQRIMNTLNSPGGRLIFGLRERDYNKHGHTRSLLLVGHIENLCTLLLDAVATIGDINEANTWRSRWSSFALKGSFVQSTCLQCRSLVVLGCLAKIQVDDAVLSRVLKTFVSALYVANLATNEDYVVCTMFCMSKMVEGLPTYSPFCSKLFWLGVSALKTTSVNHFVYGTQLIRSTLITLDERGVFEGTNVETYFLEGQKPFKESWDTLNSVFDVSFRVQNFHLAMCSSLAKGLTNSVMRQGTLQLLETLLEVCSKNHVRNETSSLYPQYLSYLYLLYLGCKNQEDLRNLLWAAGYPPVHDETAVQQTNIDRMPSLLRSYLNEDSEGALLTLFLGCHIFNTCHNYNVMEMRFLHSLHEIDDSRDKWFMIYSHAREKIADLIRLTPDEALLRACMKSFELAVRDFYRFSELQTFKMHAVEIVKQAGLYELTVKEPPVRSVEEKIKNRDLYAKFIYELMQEAA